MKKIIFTLALAMIAIGSMAQQKGLYLTISGDVAATKFNYQMDNGAWSKAGVGFGGGLGVQYFFTRHFGLSLGANIQKYNSYATYNNSWDNNDMLRMPGMIDTEIHNPNLTNYEMLLATGEWREKQQAYLVEVPLMLQFQTKWGKQQRHGMYFGIGAKAQIPVFGEEYKVDGQGELTVLGYYTPANVLIGDGAATHGFGTATVDAMGKDNYKGDLDFSVSWAGTAE
ncbi:outer membrane beta-barrel protein, partial [Bacteroidales bacterium OttesenSCG-928-J16]|nr:outer membrane beta-barrel protein [Bacteroidales bacterium OttesenSCG-928-J16]